MTLPKIDLPLYDLHLKSLGKNIRYRPFTVKEEKILMIALESNEFSTIVDAVKQVINNCIADDLDVDALPMFELEYLFLNLRARSIGEKVQLTFVCQNVVGENNSKCNNEMETDVDLLQVALEMKEVNDTIMITSDVGIKLKFPSIDATKHLQKDPDNGLYKLIEECTEYLFDKDQTYPVSELQENEFFNFIDGLTKEQFEKIKYFFENIPNVKYEGDLTCNKCGKIHRIFLEGILDFFE